MFISLSGQLGSGKSTLCNYLKEHKGFEIFSTGAIHRKLAKERNLSTLEFNEVSKGDRSIDLLIDDEMKRYSRENGAVDTVFDSRLAWHFVERSFKVFLLVSPKVAAERVFCNRILEEENYSSKEDALKGLIKRREIETKRFKEFYGVDCDDYANYDLIADTSYLTTEKIADIIFEAYEYFIRNRPYTKCFVSPKNLYPTKKITENHTDAHTFDANPSGAVRVFKVKNSLFISEGHKSAAAAIAKGEAVIPAEIIFGIVKSWEESNGFSFGYDPFED
ncbi:MAG: cytidylate kinase family protein [Clostridiales bacterium]|jgi:cytidylate kinase|nr:cytidylate kinase family protein [Clostridiales bacterium]